MPSLALDPSPYLETKALCRRLDVHEVLDSTNEEARRLARTDAPHGTAVVARSQTRGRGRRGHSWYSPEGSGLYLSFLLRPELSPKRAPLLTLATAVALRAAIQEVAVVSTEIKWPNDLLTPGDRRKVAGILVEVSGDAAKIAHAVVGIGVNLARTEWPRAIAGRATSLEELANAPVDAARLVGVLSNALERRLEILTREGGQPILAEWTAHAAGLGEPCIVRDGGTERSGVLVGVQEDGALLLRTEEETRKIYAGDLFLSGM